MPSVFTVKFIDKDLDDRVIVAERYEVNDDRDFTRFYDHENREISAIVFHLILEIASGHTPPAPSPANATPPPPPEAGMRPPHAPAPRLPVETAAAQAARRP